MSQQQSTVYILSEGKFQENKDWNSAIGDICCWSNGIRGQVPRKQGLKRLKEGPCAETTSNPRASSKKTRIETPAVNVSVRSLVESEGKFQENKDWNYQAY